jgi:tetratricopeptide (TPR) repeat protein
MVTARGVAVNSLSVVVLCASVSLWLILPGSARAGGAKTSAVAQAQLDEGLNALYSLDYAQSRRASRKLIELEPDNPFGYLFEAGAIWWQASQEFGLFKGTPTLQGLFEQDIEAGMRKSEAYIDSKDKQAKADGYFVAGMTLGVRGQWSLMKGKWLDAYFDGKKSMKYLKKVVKIDENYEDVYLGLGVFDYQAAHMSGIAKLGVLFGMRGDEKRGLERIQRAVDRASFARRQAAQMLSSIYLIDMHDDARALTVIQQLRRDFPGSPYFIFLEAMLRHRLGDWDGSLTLGRELHKLVAADPKAFRHKWLTLACGLSGPDCLGKADMERTLVWLDHALDATAKERPDSFRTLLRLLRGQTLDVLGRRDEAVKDYQRAEFLPAIGESRDVARACLAAPCDRETVLKRLRAWSKED